MDLSSDKKVSIISCITGSTIFAIMTRSVSDHWRKKVKYYEKQGCTEETINLKDYSVMTKCNCNHCQNLESEHYR
jgi:hypothetical protein